MNKSARILATLTAVWLGAWPVQRAAGDNFDRFCKEARIEVKANSEAVRTRGEPYRPVGGPFPQGQDRPCTVADPTGTLLNARDMPNGSVMSTLKNGTVVHIEELGADSRGHSWAKVSDADRKILGWVLREYITCEDRQSSDAPKPGSLASLVAAISKEYPGSDRSPFSLIHIGLSQYLVRDGKVIRTKKATRFGGLCGGYAGIWMTVSDEQMQEQSEGEGSMWKLDGGQWKVIFNSSAGDWKCEDVRRIPGPLRKCLGVDKCS
jgi:hypothetical protein